MWIDRIISDSPEGAQETDLHERLTVISSADAAKRRAPFDIVKAALSVAPGTTMEVRTEFGDTISAHRTNESTALFDTRSKLPVHADDRSLGVVGWLNDPALMSKHMDFFHVTSANLRQRVKNDADLIQLAQTPLDQLFALASEITSAEDNVAQVRDERSELTDTKREREDRERKLHTRLEEHKKGKKTAQFVLFAALALVIAGIAIAILVEPLFGLGVCIAGVIVAVVSKVLGKNSGSGEVGTESSDIQLGRIDELFSTQSLTQNRRGAEDGLEQSKEKWRSIAGESDPSVLLRDRPRIEELASHLELISVAQVNSPGDTSILVGLASLLAELSRRFPAERVPLLVEDLFADVEQQYHALLREQLLRASHRRQVIIETADIEVAKWAAVEAVGSDALLITDYDIDVEPIIAAAQAVTAENTPSV